jgi:hypothetical protein
MPSTRKPAALHESRFAPSLAVITVGESVFDNGEICFALAYCFGEILAISAIRKNRKDGQGIGNADRGVSAETLCANAVTIFAVVRTTSTASQFTISSHHLGAPNVQDGDARPIMPRVTQSDYDWARRPWLRWERHTDHQVLLSSRPLDRLNR